MRTEAAGIRRPFVVCLAALGSFALLAGTAGTAEAAWDGSATVKLGDSFGAEIAGIPEEAHEYVFYAPQGTSLSAALRVLPGGDLVPRLELLTESGTEVDLGTAQVGTTIKNYVFATSGRFALRVTAQSGAGEYVLRTKAKCPPKRGGTVAASPYAFPAVRGTLLSAAIKPARGSGAVPSFNALTGPKGAVNIGAGGTRLVNVLLANDGNYSLGWANTGAAGDVVVGLKLKAPKKPHFYYFGAMDDTPGLADSMRDKWLESGHADRFAQAFTYSSALGTSCAKCHGEHGYRDFLGVDGTAAGVVNNAAPEFSTVTCNACHNSATTTLTSVTFPSGNVVTGLGREARCMLCHQGRESTVSVNTAIGASLDDDVVATLSFKNVHYFSAGATLMGREAGGGYEFTGKWYDGKFTHVSEADTCVECHDAHSLEVKVDLCATCHTGMTGVDYATKLAKAKDIRMDATLEDHDGDGNVTEGVYHEIHGLADKLLAAIYATAKDVNGQAIVFGPDNHPYWFKDLDADGVLDVGVENVSANSYKSWSPRLLRAAYDYQFWKKDPGAFAHNPKYVIELLYDAIEHLDAHANVTVAGMADLRRNDPGHFDATSEAFRHWDDDPEGRVSAGCARCHSTEGFLFRVDTKLDPTSTMTAADGFSCEHCHVGGDFGTTAARRYVASVTFPSLVQSPVTVNNDPADPDDSFLCMTCHCGRESKATVDDRIAKNSFSFRNVHYLPAGGMLYGNVAKVGYEYTGKTYAGKWTHSGGPGSRCTLCHLDDHSFEPKLSATCAFCHAEAGGDIERIRLNRATDYDGDGNATEKLKDEVATYEDRLYAAIQAYVLAKADPVTWPPIAYSAAHHPYWFKDTNGNGVVDADETTSYPKWDAATMKAAFNYQFSHKEPGGWAHNTPYLLQLLFDSIEDVGGSTAGLTRP